MSFQLDVLRERNVKLEELQGQALVFREFWKRNSDTCIFDVLQENTESRSFMTSANMHSECQNKLLPTWRLTEYERIDTYQYKAKLVTWIVNGKDSFYSETTWPSIEQFYKDFIYQKGGTEYTIELQDDKTTQILKEAHAKFGENMHVDLYELFSEPKEKEEYFYFCNPLFSLLRLEYQKLISIEWFWSFGMNMKSQEYFAECRLTILDKAVFSKSSAISDKQSKNAKPIHIKIDASYNLLVDGICIVSTPIQKGYLKQITLREDGLEELLDGLKLKELANNGEEMDDEEEREKAQKSVKNAFSTLNKKINDSSIRKKDIFVVSQTTGISLNASYEFQIDSELNGA